MMAYARASMLLDALMRIEYRSPVPVWKKHSHWFPIKNVHYDHLAQVLRVSNPPTRPLAAPLLRSMQENYLALKGKFPGVKVGAKLDSVFSTVGDDMAGESHGSEGRRTRCDVCYIVGHTFLMVITDCG